MRETRAEPDCRVGITVYVREVVPGDQVRDRGIVRTIASVTPVEGNERSSLLHFEPVGGYPPTIHVPNRNQLYVRRACGDRSSGRER